MGDVAAHLTDAAAADVIAGLTKNASEHGFLQLVRILERTLVVNSTRDRSGGGGDERGLVGTDAMPAVEPIRFAAAPSLGFASTQVQSLRPFGSSALPLEVVVNFLGLIGPAGALPRHYTATAIARSRDKDDSLIRFLDLFHSRLLALFYRAFARYDAATAFEMRQRRPDVFTLMLRSEVGFAERAPIAGLQGASIGDHDVLGFAGLYAHGHRSAAALQQMLAAQLRLPVHIEQYSGQWLDVPPDQQTRLPDARGFGAMHSKLGANVVLGNRVWDAASRLCVRVGPLDFDRYVEFVTDGAGLRRAGVLARLYVRQEFDLLIRPVLKKEAVPLWRLRSDPATKRQLLGRTIWLRSESRPFAADFSAAAYSPPESGAPRASTSPSRAN